MPKPLHVFFDDPAKAVWRRLTPDQHAQALRLIRALVLAPEAGASYAKDLRGRSLSVVSAATIHLIYRIHYRVSADRLYVVNIDIAAWEPQHPGNE